MEALHSANRVLARWLQGTTRYYERHTTLVWSSAAAYSFWYLSVAVKRPVVSATPDGKLESAVGRCRLWSRLYWPTFYAPTAFLQLLLFASKELGAVVTPSPYSREVVELSDSQQIALDWRQPDRNDDDEEEEAEAQRKTLGGGGDQRPVVVLLHGAFESSHSAPMRAISGALAAQGMLSVVMNRRGYEMDLTVDKVSMYGFDDDLSQVSSLELRV